jgi:ABC-type transport system involved in cytochrome c biogenesis permease subunit
MKDGNRNLALRLRLVLWLGLQLVLQLALALRSRLRLRLAFHFAFIFCFTSIAFGEERAQALQSTAALTAPIRYLPVLDGGRIKPYDTFTREILQLIYGKSTFDGRPAYEIVTTWWLQPDLWKDKPLFEINHRALKTAMGVGMEIKHLSLDQLLANPRLPDLFQELQIQRDKKIKLDPFGQSVQRLENQIFTFRELASGRLLKIVPDSSNSSHWKNLMELNEEEKEKVLNLTQAFIQTLDLQGSESLRSQLEGQIQDFQSLWRLSSLYDERKINLEVHYSNFHPFRWASIFYVLVFLVTMVAWIFRINKLTPLMWTLSSVGLGLHLYGFVLRSYLTGRAPVTNMYETVVWVAFGAVLFSMILEWIYRWKMVLAAGSAVAAFCLILSDMAPAVLDPTLQPLEPVLRSNFWLTIHVLMIVISYAAFFLAFALGDIGLFFVIKDENRYQDRIRALVLACYRSMQIGVGFFAPGIILGAFWADFSWGRFWGWDPKETWSLIALLGYLAVMHARLVGWLKEFGMLVTSVLTFGLVIMAWYGVNFWQGAGLHTYGFGAGGIESVVGFMILHLVYLVFAVSVRFQRSKAKD